MGCVASKVELDDPQESVFRVWNVDKAGRAVTPGQLQVTSAELVLYQQGRTPVRWPMRCLRRYGFDAELFSFESGRRCPTGPGIYAFRCRRAETLFNLLQEHIQASGQDDQSHASSGAGATGNAGPTVTTTASMGVPRSASLSEGGYLEPAPKGRPPRGLPGSLPGSLSSSSTGLLSPTAHTSSPHYVNEELLVSGASGGGRTPSPHEYMNTTAMQECSPPLLELVGMKGGNGCCATSREDDNYARLDDLVKQEHTAIQRLYMNVKRDERSASSGSSTREHYYANIGKAQSSVLTSAQHAAQVPVASQQLNPTRQVNYVVLDLDHPGPTTPTSPLSLTSLPDSPVRGADGYATIDFDRTTALSNSTNPSLENDDSQRKTRHNSSISELILSRHNSAVSE